MKKTALLLVLTIILSLAMTSCQPMLEQILPLLTDLELMLSEPENATEAWENVDKRMDSLASYETKMNLSLNMTANGTTADIRIIGTAIEMDDYYYQSVRNSIKLDGTEIVSENLLAYDEGKMYVLSSRDKVYSRFCSNLSIEDFNSYLEDNSTNVISSDIFKKAFTQEFTKNEDSTITIKFADFPKSDVEKALTDLGIESVIEAIDDTVDDISVEILADSKYRAMSLTVSFIREGEKQPLMEAKTTYSKYNSAQKAEIEADKYIEIADARIPGLISESLLGKINQESGDFTLDTTHVFSSGTYTQTVHSETDKVHFENDPTEGFSFNVSAVYSGTSCTITYNNGTMTTVVVGSGSARDSMTDAEARLFINQLITSIGYEPYMVDSIKEQIDGSYLIVCKIADETTYKQLISEAGLGSYNGYELTLEVKMNGEEVDTLTSRLVIKGTSGKYVVSSSFAFDIKETEGNNDTNAA